MDTFEAVRTVLATRQYQDKPIPKEIVNKIIEAGRLTGSSRNGQPWHFLVVEDRDTLSKFSDIITTGRYIYQAPLAVVVLVNDSEFAVSDGSRAIQSMILTAWSEGIGSNWTGFMGPDQVKPLLGIPDGWNVLAVLPFGYPVKPAGKGKKKRKPLEEVASREKFGKKY